MEASVLVRSGWETKSGECVHFFEDCRSLHGAHLHRVAASSKRVCSLCSNRRVLVRMRIDSVIGRELGVVPVSSFADLVDCARRLSTFANLMLLLVREGQLRELPSSSELTLQELGIVDKCSVIVVSASFAESPRSNHVVNGPSKLPSKKNGSFSDTDDEGICGRTPLTSATTTSTPPSSLRKTVEVFSNGYTSYSMVDLAADLNVEESKEDDATLHTTSLMYEIQNASENALCRANVFAGEVVLETLRKNFVEIDKEDIHPEWISFGGTHPSHEWIDGGSWKSAAGNSYWRQAEYPTKFHLAHVMDVCERVHALVLKDPMEVKMRSPTYILGDLHGNYRDLSFFATRCWPFGPDVSASNFLFLGDYVDRGPHSFEVVMYLFGLKLQCPEKVVLLRGNHEDRSINEQKDFCLSFLQCCVALFGKNDGKEVWARINDVFDCLPVCAVIDGKIFGCHAGIPRHFESSPDIFDDIRSLHRPEDTRDVFKSRDGILCDLLWSDPIRADSLNKISLSTKNKARIEEMLAGVGKNGFSKLFGPNIARGAELSSFADDEFQVCVWTNEAAELFFEKTGCTHIIRAHEHRKEGLAMQNYARVITVFSTSAYQETRNSAAICFYHNEKLDVIVAKFDRE